MFWISRPDCRDLNQALNQALPVFVRSQVLTYCSYSLSPLSSPYPRSHHLRSDLNASYGRQISQVTTSSSPWGRGSRFAPLSPFTSILDQRSCGIVDDKLSPIPSHATHILLSQPNAGGGDDNLQFPLAPSLKDLENFTSQTSFFWTCTNTRHGQEASVAKHAFTGVDQPVSLVIRIGYDLPLA